MFKKICDYCGKPIKNDRYYIHLHIPKFDGVIDKYYHYNCYLKTIEGNYLKRGIK
jgi:hypothetical protein